VGELCFDFRLLYADWIKCVMNREWGICVFRGDCVSGIG